MDIENVRRIAPLFAAVERIVLSGWGEPLLHPDLEEAVRIVRAAGARPGFVTSGKGLTRDRMEGLVEAGLDFIGFSLAGATRGTHEGIRRGSDFHEVLEAVRMATAASRQRHRDRPSVHIVYLMLRDNLAEVTALPALAAGLGIRVVLLTHLTLVTNPWQEEQKVFSCDPRADLGDAERLLRQGAAAASRLGIRLTPPPLRPNFPAVCAENPLENLFISPQGELAPCVYLQTPLDPVGVKLHCGQPFPVGALSYGNVLRQPFEEIAHGAPYVEFLDIFRKRRVGGAGREGEAPPAPCRTCHKMLGF
jgi:MoaA/NifB/PqqE/SkfB family radical SAM enzyme